MRDQGLKAFSEEVKKGFVDALGADSYFAPTSIVRFFTDELTGDQCAIVRKNGEEICMLAKDAFRTLINQ